jgi:spore coat polysaccharide biosynthesis protein SpsF
MTVTAVVQARMSSARFPGKVLTAFRGEPVIVHVVRAAEAAVGRGLVVVATSVDRSDDPLDALLRARGTPVVRGSLDNVLARFQDAASGSTSEWILRLNGDSPLLDVAVLRRVIDAADDSCDLVTTIQPRTFPKGRNAELIRRLVLLAVDAVNADAEEREHPTQFFYRRPQRFRIRNVASANASLAAETLSIDTPEDLVRLERLTDADLGRYAG